MILVCFVWDYQSRVRLLLNPDWLSWALLLASLRAVSCLLLIVILVVISLVLFLVVPEALLLRPRPALWPFL
jgi:hypothetical protein